MPRKREPWSQTYLVPRVPAFPVLTKSRATSSNWTARTGNRRPLLRAKLRKSSIQHHFRVTRRLSGAPLASPYRLRCAQGCFRSKLRRKDQDCEASSCLSRLMLVGTSKPKTTLTFVRLLAGKFGTKDRRRLFSAGGGGSSSARAASQSLSLHSSSPPQKQKSSQPHGEERASSRTRAPWTWIMRSSSMLPVSHSWMTSPGSF
mmetsp:Transcript_105803/g.299047  ORF Transcript_105803/g.299047 Transcript_105803/m.299047 type:complete len:203 (+) Transcript_105803:450-1058(+)